MKLNQFVIMKSKPNTLATFKWMTKLAKLLQDESGNYFNVIIDNNLEEVQLARVCDDEAEE